MSAVTLDKVWEKYHIKFVSNGKVSWEEIWALKDISFEVNKGEVFGIIGQNGAGKTTLLKLIAGMLIPDRGTIAVNGKVSVLMELGAGFNPEFTGRENIAINARVYGLEEETLKPRMEMILEFAGLGKFIDAPIKYYSQGMYMRLAFALAIFVEPDILLIDDILAVGDEEAQQKCVKKIFELKKLGKTIILASHDMNMMARLADRAILLEKGKIIKEAVPQKVIPAYRETIGDQKGIAVLERDKLRVVFNNGRISIDYEGLPLTKEAGGYLSFFDPPLNTWVSSLNLSWQVKNPAPDKIVAEGRSPNEVLSQTWTMELYPERLEWQVQIKEKVNAPQIDLLLVPEYNHWANVDKDGDFSPFVSKNNWHSMDAATCPEGLLGLVAIEEKTHLPALILERQDRDGQIKLFNTGYEQEARAVKLYMHSHLILATIRLFGDKDKFADYIKHCQNQFLLKQQEEAARLLAQRTISSDRLRLFADIENKALRLYYKDKELTRGSGFHGCFLINQTWHDLDSCEWKAERDGDRLLLKFFWRSFNLTQVCSFSLEDNRLFWKIDSQAGQDLLLGAFKFGVSLQPEYKTFFCGHQQADFSQAADARQDMPLENPSAELFGVRKTGNLPAIIFKNDRSLACSIKNNDLPYSCRSLYLNLPPGAMKDAGISIASEFNFLEEESPIESYLIKKKETIVMKQREESSRAIAQCSIHLGPFYLFVDVKNKAVKIHHNTREITSGKGLYATMLLTGEKTWIHSLDAEWSVNKLSDRELILTWDYRIFLFRQICTLRWTQENTLEILVSIETDKTLSLVYKDLRLELVSAFERWKTAYETGDFYAKQYVNDIIPIRLKDNKVSKIAFEPRQDCGLVPVTFDLFSSSQELTLSLFKKREGGAEYLCVSSCIVVPKKSQLTAPEKIDFLQAKLIFGGGLALKEVSPDIIRLGGNNLQFIFDRGKAKIIWKQKELTKGLGVYTSMRSKGIWYDSYQAIWNIAADSNGNTLVVKGEWPYIPIAQTWRIELKDKNLIHWKVDMEVYEEIFLEIEQANLMLSTEYKEWFIPALAKGVFYDEYTEDYDILPFRFWYGRPINDGLMATGKGIPEISFNICASLHNGCFNGIVENSDALFRARLLQYQKTNPDKLLPGRYSYFEGVMAIKLTD